MLLAEIPANLVRGRSFDEKNLGSGSLTLDKRDGSPHRGCDQGTDRLIRPSSLGRRRHPDPNPIVVHTGDLAAGRSGNHPDIQLTSTLDVPDRITQFKLSITYRNFAVAPTILAPSKMRLPVVRT